MLWSTAAELHQVSPCLRSQYSNVTVVTRARHTCSALSHPSAHPSTPCEPSPTDKADRPIEPMYVLSSCHLPKYIDLFCLYSGHASVLSRDQLTPQVLSAVTKRNLTPSSPVAPACSIDVIRRGAPRPSGCLASAPRTSWLLHHPLDMHHHASPVHLDLVTFEHSGASTRENTLQLEPKGLGDAAAMEEGGLAGSGPAGA